MLQSRGYVVLAPLSLPSRGAWIEMAELEQRYERHAVAPLTGSVD